MTIDEAIKNHKKLKILAKGTNDKRGAFYSAEEHEQLAEWLEELKNYRDKNKMVVRFDVENMDSIKYKIDELSRYAENQYNKAVDDFADKLNAKCDGMIKEEWNSNVAPISWAEAYADFKDDIDEIAEQLKAGGENGQSI